VLGLKFRRQHVLHGFIVDFCCFDARIVLEVDGNAHGAEPRRGYDVARAAVLEAAGFQVLRIANRDVTRDQLVRVLRAGLKNSQFVPPLPQGEGDRG
jgi:very-short-patch-repair endonuclease